MPAKLLKDRLELLKSKALFDGAKQSVFLRVGKEKSEEEEGPRALYVDLCDKKWRAVKITTGGWEVVDQPPIFFRRNLGMWPLPIPAHGGSVDELAPFLNITLLCLGQVSRANQESGKRPFTVEATYRTGALPSQGAASRAINGRFGVRVGSAKNLLVLGYECIHRRFPMLRPKLQTSNSCCKTG